MELTPELLTDEVEFRTALRGYERGQVDAFLERVANAVAKLQQRLKDAEQLSGLEGGGPAGVADDSVTATVEAAHRTLTLAQRTADEAVREAREEADRLLEETRAEVSRLEAEAAVRSEEAHAEAVRLTEEAQAEATRLTEQATAEANRVTEEAAEAAEELRTRTAAEVQAEADRAREILNAEIEVLARSRASVENDLGLLDRHLAERREAVLGVLADLIQVLDDPARLRLGLPEGLSGPAEADAAEHDPTVTDVLLGTPEPVASDSDPSTEESAHGEDQQSGSATGNDETSTSEASGELGQPDPGFRVPGEADLVEVGATPAAEDDGSDSQVHWRFDIPSDQHGDTDPDADKAAPNEETARWEFDDDLAGDGGEHPDFWRTASEQDASNESQINLSANADDTFLVELRQAMTGVDGAPSPGAESGVRESPEGEREDDSGRNRRGFGRRR